MAKAKEQPRQADPAPAALPSELLALIKEWTACYKKVKELEAQAKVLSESMAKLEGPILSGLEVAEIERMSMDGLTIFCQEQLWAKAGENTTPQMVAEALRKAKLPEFTTFNSQSFSAYVREIAAGVEWEDPKELLLYLPKPLQAVVQLTNKQSLRARKSN